ncbi:major facilitator superfamily transporter phospholipid transporter [Grosmannia clavigera kw1407]|uniref:Major facilitator superfamily transporter phospholipid transporter n=1 Tax=Grosmannia clavigera (strain kw1407 / UAMH 11150) TaxID=655863 RepID=F0XBZ1_GROCL|nr:major facilitator superfamily transporter phospholipid transporter [Grosmannia clavigera kw1407]EFX04699.1 major facilitator superfamily transporter phospholipid transporter [Grosmannia clavigera kw1407]
MGMLDFRKRKEEEETAPVSISEMDAAVVAPASEKMVTLSVAACGAGLFSDGYVNNVIGSVTTVLSLRYGNTWKHSHAKSVVSAIAFAGTVVGQLFFGVLADRWSRTNSLLVSTVILFIFTALAAGSYFHGSVVGMFNILTAWRFFVGIGIGGEYPAGSVGCAEATGEIKSGWRHFIFIIFTNSLIDVGFVAGAFVPYVVAAACHNEHLDTQWRTMLGIGCVFPFLLFFMRIFAKEPEEFTRNSMRNVRTPYWLVFRFYGFRLLIVSLIWFIYDFLTYAFGIYSSAILSNIFDSDAPLTTVFGWNVVINLFYLPGSILGAKASDVLGPRWCLIIGVFLQAIIGFAMAGDYKNLSQPHMVGAFATVYGIFLSLGEFGPGNNIGLLAAKTSATGIRGQYYGIAAAFGKIGAFVGTYVYPYIEKAGGSDTNASAQYPFYVSSSLCILSAILALLFLPNVGQDTIALEDIRFREYLEKNGWDTRQLGMRMGESIDVIENAEGVPDSKA